MGKDSPKHEAIAELLRAMDGYQGSFVTRCTLRLAPLLFVRPGELRKAEWVEIDLDKAEWNIPAERMKMREPHLVPLSTQAVGHLRELHTLTGSGRYVFPGARIQPHHVSRGTPEDDAAMGGLSGQAQSRSTSNPVTSIIRVIHA